MKIKRLAVLAIIFAALALLYFMSEQASKKDELGEIPIIFADFDKDGAFKITINSPEKDSVVMEKEQQVWSIVSDNETYRADIANINKLLDTTSGLKAGTVASRNPANFESFEVTKNSGVEVIIKDRHGNPTASFFVGKSGPDIFSTYLKKAGSQEVILTEGILKTVFEKDINDWRDKTIFDLPAKDIVKYSVAGDSSFVLEKDQEGKWSGIEPGEFPVKQQEANRAVERFAELKSAGFEKGDLEEFGLDEQQKKITVFLKDESSKTLLLGKEKNSFQNFAMVEGETQVYVVENYNIETMMPDIDDLREKTDEEKDSDNSTEEVNR